MRDRTIRVEGVPVNFKYGGDAKAGYFMNIGIDQGRTDAPPPITLRNLSGGELSAYLMLHGAPKADVQAAALGLPI